MDTELCTLRSRFINVFDTDELKSKLHDIFPFDKKGYKIISVLGLVKKFQGFVECSMLDTPGGFIEFVKVNILMIYQRVLFCHIVYQQFEPI